MIVIAILLRIAHSGIVDMALALEALARASCNTLARGVQLTVPRDIASAEIA